MEHIEAISVFNFPYFKFHLFLWIIYTVLFFLLRFLIKKTAVSISYIEYFLGLGLISIGFVTGIIMGNNRNPISETIMSSVFALMGTVITYAFLTKDKAERTDTTAATTDGPDTSIIINDTNKLTAALFLILFPLSLLYGTHIGGLFRFENESINRAIEYNTKLKMDTLEVYKHSQESDIQTRAKYNEKIYETWSENEKKRYQALLEQNKHKVLPEVPDYGDTTTAKAKSN